jgi:hypothetical protein
MGGDAGGDAGDVRNRWAVVEAVSICDAMRRAVLSRLDVLRVGGE